MVSQLIDLETIKHRMKLVGIAIRLGLSPADTGLCEITDVNRHLASGISAVSGLSSRRSNHRLELKNFPLLLLAFSRHKSATLPLWPCAC